MTAFLKRRDFLTPVDAQVKSMGGIPDYMYVAMLRYMRHNSDTEQETKRLAVGRYRLFRPSLKLPDMFTVGLFDVTINSDSEALCVRELRNYTQVKPTEKEREAADKGNVSAQLKVRLEHERSFREEFHGYLVRKRRRYVCFQRAATKGNPNFVFTVFQDEFMEGDGTEARIASLGGIAFGTTGSRVYISRVFIERCPENETLEQLEQGSNYFPVHQIKPSVVAYLRIPAANPFYQVF